jgi:hypothetical protein
MGMCAARLVFLLTSLDGGHDDWEAQYVVLALSALSVVLQTSCFEHLRSSAPREKRIFLASAVNRADVSARWVGVPSWRDMEPTICLRVSTIKRAIQYGRSSRARALC